MQCNNCGLALDPQQVAQTGVCPRCGVQVAPQGYSAFQPGSYAPTFALGASGPQQMGYPPGAAFVPGYQQPLGVYPPPGQIVQPGVIVPAGGVIIVQQQGGNNSGKGIASLVLGILGILLCGLLLLSAIGYRVAVAEVSSNSFNGGVRYETDLSGFYVFLVFALIMPVIAVILGHLGVKDVVASGGRMRGKGMGQAGLIMGYLSGALALLSFILVTV